MCTVYTLLSVSICPLKTLLFTLHLLLLSPFPQSLQWRRKRKERDAKGELEQEASFANVSSAAGPKRRRMIAPQPHSETTIGSATTAMVGFPRFWIPLIG